MLIFDQINAVFVDIRIKNIKNLIDHELLYILVLYGLRSIFNKLVRFHEIKLNLSSSALSTDTITNNQPGIKQENCD